MANLTISKVDIQRWLQEGDLVKLEELWGYANSLRIKHVGEAIYLRGLLEVSNYCLRSCAYCGINRNCSAVQRYRMSKGEIITSIKKIVDLGYGTVVIQGGEDYGLTREFISEIIQYIKKTTFLAIALSLGERSLVDLAEWKANGADRYFLRFETSDRGLYNLIHPDFNWKENINPRIDLLANLRNLGYEIGSGVMIGIPGQSYWSLAEDILLFRQLDLDMIGVGPYISSHHTPLGMGQIDIKDIGSEQVVADPLMTYKVIALARIVCPNANITSTTALATLDQVNGRNLGLQRGANIFMPNVTPINYREHYEIYPGKKSDDDAEEISDSIKKLGRKMGIGAGSRKKLANDSF